MFTRTNYTSDHHYSNSIGIRPMLATKWRFTNTTEVAPNCPRCASTNTKFCYYNNYSLSQPRYFCKGCRRYWTKGGSLRNVPVGGGCRKSRRSRAACRQPDPAPGSSSDGSSSSNGGTCIDMAAVFAKYVNHQNLENIHDDQSSTSFSPGASTGSSSDNVQASGGTAFDVDSQFEDINNNNTTSLFEYDQMMQQQQQVVVMPDQISTCQDVSGQQFVYDGLELHQQGVLCDELWLEGTTSLPHLEPMVQVEECGLFAADDDDDQLRISANLVSDNWGSFDLSAAYDFYSTPN